MVLAFVIFTLRNSWTAHHLFLGGFGHLERPARIEHYGVLVGVQFVAHLARRFRVRSVMDTLRMPRYHTCVDTVPTEKVAIVIEQHFIVINIPVVDHNGDFERFIGSVIAHLPLARPSRTRLLSRNHSLLVFIFR